MVELPGVNPPPSAEAELDRQTMLFIAGFSAVINDLTQQFAGEGGQFDIRAPAGAIVRVQAMILGSIGHPVARKDLRRAMERRLPIELAMFNSQRKVAQR